MLMTDLIKMYLEKLIKDYCFVNFEFEECELFVNECIDHKKLNELSKNIALKLLQNSDTYESQFKQLTGANIQSLIKINR